MPDHPRVLVTGSRFWPDPELVGAALGHIAHLLEWTFILVHGDCPTGADAIAQRWADKWADGVGDSITVERHPADWNRFGKAAGPIRNQEMVELGAVVCLAFPLAESRGTRECMRRAREAGIRVFDYSHLFALRATR